MKTTLLTYMESSYMKLKKKDIDLKANKKPTQPNTTCPLEKNLKVVESNSEVDIPKEIALRVLLAAHLLFSVYKGLMVSFLYVIAMLGLNQEP